ncbi:Ig-like domain-containing protein, partial [Desulfosarcina sp. OttesenSCG-928-A07]|nr:Ig-like domain-containing protein [Desulfosarcina sp. OttesenSCG-928-A07]
MVYQLNRSQVTEMSRVGNDLVIHLTNGSSIHLDGFFAGGAEKVLLFKESDGSIWQVNFAQDGNSTVMTGYDPYEGDTSWADALPPAEETLASPPKDTWDGYAIEIQSYTDDVGGKQGDFPPGTTTDDPAPRLNGLVKGLQPGDQIRIYGDGEFLGYAQVDGQGNWYFHVPRTSNGHHSYMARIVNAEGMESDFSASFVLNIDIYSASVLLPWIIGGLGALGVGLAIAHESDSGGSSRRHTPPSQQKVAIETVDDDVAPDIHIVQSGGATNDPTPTLNGTLSESLGGNEVLAVYRLNASTGVNERVGTAAIDAEALTWTFTDPGLSQDGVYTYTAQAENATTGLSTSISNAYVIELDTTNPASGVTTITTISGEDVPVASGGYTTDTTPTIEGTLQSGSLNTGEYLEVLRNGEVIGTATIDANGVDWTFTDLSLGEAGGGRYLYTVRLVDAAGNQSAPSDAYELTLLTDALSQTVTIGAIMDNYGTATGRITSGGNTDDATPTLEGTITGSLGATDVVVIYRDGTEVGTASVSGQTWRFTDNLASDGSYSYTAFVKDSSGTLGTPSSAYSIVLSTSVVPTPTPAATVTLQTITDNVGSDTGNIGKGGTTDDASPELAGTLSRALVSGESVVIYRDGTEVGTASVSGQTWRFTDNLASDGSYSYTACVKDAAGKLGTPSSAYAIILDTSVVLTPATVEITAILDDVNPATGDIGLGGTTDDMTPILEGTISTALAAGESVVIYRNDMEIGTASVSGLTWTFMDILSSDDAYTYKAVVQGVGYEGEVSNTYNIILDTSEVIQSVQILKIVDAIDP